MSEIDVHSHVRALGAIDNSSAAISHVTHDSAALTCHRIFYNCLQNKRCAVESLNATLIYTTLSLSSGSRLNPFQVLGFEEGGGELNSSGMGMVHTRSQSRRVCKMIKGGFSHLSILNLCRQHSLCWFKHFHKTLSKF